MIPAEYIGAAAKVIAAFEGCERRQPGTNLVVPYPDPAHGWRVPTIGFGEVCKVSDGPYTIEQCWERLFARIANEYGAAAWEGPMQASPLIFAAVTSFTWNLGIAAFKGSGMRAALMRGDYAGAASNCRKWVFAGNKRLLGLVRRRDLEARMLLAGSRTLQ
jgi:GH24 family phage-related lysozyme (muramidase)